MVEVREPSKRIPEAESQACAHHFKDITRETAAETFVPLFVNMRGTRFFLMDEAQIHALVTAVPLNAKCVTDFGYAGARSNFFPVVMGQRGRTSQKQYS